MAQEQFEVGRWVWWWNRQAWYKIARVWTRHDNGATMIGVEGDESLFSANQFTANPVIPPKPKRTVKKDGWVYPEFIHNNSGNSDSVQSYNRRIRVTYEVEE